ncbi:hypothetical protein AA21291_0174 [Swaminathania salitolerans LMG 21291]|uniref:Uncharacterized protein n=1 Tax=Swaminathania salitolerans TaxID=182838 RepID=A0A511BKH7_9PROT|nr:hypothetical protein AA21291_0174 [Swaminathania salitolerans LMG 21291]GEL00869.1 hypothetical protein SSA02_00320 [Swaminathania salitolerans]
MAFVSERFDCAGTFVFFGETPIPLGRGGGDMQSCNVSTALSIDPGFADPGGRAFIDCFSHQPSVVSDMEGCGSSHGGRWDDCGRIQVFFRFGAGFARIGGSRIRGEPGSWCRTGRAQDETGRQDAGIVVGRYVFRGNCGTLFRSGHPAFCCIPDLDAEAA